jgi:nucleoside phosphorylase
VSTFRFFNLFGYMKIVLFFATLKEAQATVLELGAIQVNGHPLHFCFDLGLIICTGMGLNNAFKAAMNAPKENVTWINVGAAGSLDGKSCIGQIVDIDLVRLLGLLPMSIRNGGSHSVKKCASRDLPILLNDARKNVLFSSHVPVYSPIKTYLEPAFVDMEGYALAHVAKLYQVPLKIVKVVSDICSSASRATIAQNLPSLSQKMAQYCQKLVVSDL